MFADTKGMQQEVIKFCDFAPPFFKKFMELNNQMRELEKMPGITKQMLDERWKVLDKLAEKGKEHSEVLRLLIYDTLPLIHTIYNFQKKFPLTVQKLEAVIDDAKQSDKITTELEEAFRQLGSTYTIIRERIDTSKASFAEMLKIYNSLLN